MQPILAESVSRPGSTTAFAVALALVASFMMFVAVPSHYRPTHREHHQLPRLGKCVQYSYLLR